MMRAGTLSMASVVQLCRSALSDEIEAIKKKGTRPLLLSDGHLLGEEPEGGFLYAFTLDAEVILPDDVTGKLHVGDVTVDVTVVSITGFTILLLAQQMAGKEKDIPTARLVTDPSFLLSELRNRLATLQSDANARRLPAQLLMTSDAPPLAPTLKKVQTLHTSRALNVYQGEAVAHVATSAVSFVWGPPGTGKTTTLGHTVAALLRQEESVLVVAHSNAAVDAAALAVGSQTRSLPLHAEGRILRAGVSRTPGIDKAILPREVVRRQQPELIQRIEALEQERDQLTKQLASPTREQPRLKERLSVVSDQLQELRQSLRNAERALIGNARCVLCTLSKAALAEEIYTRTFDVVIVDEASMAYIPADIHVSSLAQRRVAIFGDFRQLPPITQGESRLVQEWLEPDIFDKAGIVRNVETGRTDTRLVMLAEQYRMHPEIARIIAKRFYSGKLITGAGVEAACAAIVAGLPQSGDPVVLVDTGGLQPFACKEAVEQSSASRRFGGNSRFNLVSAIVAIEMALAASREEPAPVSVGIITPYAAQARLITKLLHDLRIPRERVMCATVHRFQGSERDVIIYDTVEGKPFSRVGRLLTADGSGIEARLLNVALSRAKGKLIILADIAHLRKALPDGNVYLKVLGDIAQRVLPLRLSQSPTPGTGFAGATPLPNVERFTPATLSVEGGAKERLARDLQTAEIVAIAGVSLDGSIGLLSPTMSQSMGWSQQVRVYVGTATLPQIAPQELRWNGPDLPCLVIGIDQRILWIEGRGYALRIEHPQTVKLLYGLWNPLPESVRSLKTTEQQRELTRHGQSPLGVKCAKCGQPAWVSIAYSRPALTCTNSACGHSTQMTAAVATQYANMTRVTCPQCAGQMEGKQGADGVYLRCMSHPKCKGWRRMKDLI